MTPELNLLRDHHERLYLEVVDRYSTVRTKKDERQRFIQRIDDLLAQLRRIPVDELSLNDFLWLTDAVLKWQLVFSTLFNEPRNLELPAVPERLAMEGADQLSDKVVGRQIEETAKYHSLVRRSRYVLEPSTDEEMKEDWEESCRLFAARVLEAKLNLIGDLSTETYQRLERVWLHEAKKSMAYYLWERYRRPGTGKGKGKSQYYEVCKTLRHSLVEEKIKRTRADFEQVASYLKRYLKDDRFNAQGNDSVQNLIRGKAERISRSVSSGDPGWNWKQAIAYCRMFYEHIGTAARTGSEESTRLVLKAFNFSEGEKYRIINCFEASLAIYFLSVSAVKEAWGTGEGDWSQEFRKWVPFLGWEWKAPEGLTERFSFDPYRSELVLRGTITQQEKDRMLEAVGGERKDAVETLYHESLRVIPRLTL